MDETEKKLIILERILKRIYTRASKEMRESWDKAMQELQKEGKPLFDAIEAAKTEDEKKKAEKAYKAFLRDKTLANTYFKNMVSVLCENPLHLNQTAVQYINDALPEIYAINYNSVKDAIPFRGYSFNLVNAETVKRMSKKVENLLPYKVVNGRKDIRWNKNKINRELLQGILQGESIPEIADRFEKVMDMNRESAIRNARTTVTSTQNKGRINSYQRLEDEGLQVRKRWDATLDSRTRRSHGMLDGKTVKIDEKFSNGLLYPADPNGKPSEVYNCRCRMNADFGQKRGKARMARDKDGKSVEVPMMTWEEWIEWRESND